MSRMYHVELRQFPHNACNFNLTEQQVRSAIIDPWAREQWIELGERKWNPHQARLTVLEGPVLPVEQLAMGRGWRNAQRQSQDVTEQMLAAARQADQSARAVALDQPAASTSGGEPNLLADSLALELLATLGSEPAPLHQAWQLAAARHAGHTPSESLVIAELAVRSLLRSGLILLGRDQLAQSAQAPRGEHDIDPAREHDIPLSRDEHHIDLVREQDIDPAREHDIPLSRDEHHIELSRDEHHIPLSRAEHHIDLVREQDIELALNTISAWSETPGQRVWLRRS